MTNSATNLKISDQELATYVVCPHALSLKLSSESAAILSGAHANESKKLRREWVKKTSVLSDLRIYRRIVYLLLLGIVVALLVWEQMRAGQIHLGEVSGNSEAVLRDSLPGPESSSYLADEQKSVPQELLLLMAIVAALIMVYDRIESHNSRIGKETGIGGRSRTVMIRTTDPNSPSTELVLEEHGLSAKPDALIEDKGLAIPIIYQPLGKKVQDRQVIRLISMLKALESMHGQRSPYGVLILGKEQRRVRIQLTEEKEQWFEEVIQAVKEVKTGKDAVARPARYKCRNCDFANNCKFSVAQSSGSDRDDPGSSSDAQTNEKPGSST